jgi:hypothetical protein
MKIENTFSFQLDVADQLLLVLMKLILSLLFNDLARWFGISKGLASRMYNSWMPVLAEKLQGLVVWLPRETTRAVEHTSKSLKKKLKKKGGEGSVCYNSPWHNYVFF